MTMQQDRAALFNAIEDLTLPSPMGPITLGGGRYPGGEGAIEVQSEQGEPLFHLTHNLDPQAMTRASERGGFWVKVNEPSPIRTAALAGLIRSGLFEPSIPPEYASAGFVDRYAQLWVFSRCADEGHAGRWGAAVLCPDCLRLARAGRHEVEEVEEEFRAADITLDPSVNYMALLVENDGELELLGEFVVTSLPEAPACSSPDLVPPQPEPCLVGRDSLSESASREESSTPPDTSWCGTPAPEPVAGPDTPSSQSSYSTPDRSDASCDSASSSDSSSYSSSSDSGSSSCDSSSSSCDSSSSSSDSGSCSSGD